jgi:hypothetical protein
MRNSKLLSSVVACWLTLMCLPAPLGGQTSGFPTISQRQYTGGSAKVTVTGSAKIEADIPINTQASYSDGEMTWLQFGASGSEEPNALITYTDTKEIGITVSQGKLTVVGGITPGEKPQCSGKVKVTDKEVSGEYTCAGVATHDPAAGMGKADVKVSFIAKS